MAFCLSVCKAFPQDVMLCVLRQLDSNLPDVDAKLAAEKEAKELVIMAAALRDDGPDLFGDVNAAATLSVKSSGPFCLPSPPPPPLFPNCTCVRSH